MIPVIQLLNLMLCPFFSYHTHYFFLVQKNFVVNNSQHLFSLGCLNIEGKIHRATHYVLVEIFGNIFFYRRHFAFVSKSRWKYTDM